MRGLRWILFRYREGDLNFYIACLLKIGYNYHMNGKNWNQVKKSIGTIFIDLGKLSFGSLILGSVLRGGFDPMQTFIFGAALAIVFFIVGILVVAKTKE